MTNEGWKSRQTMHTLSLSGSTSAASFFLSSRGFSSILGTSSAEEAAAEAPSTKPATLLGTELSLGHFSAPVPVVFGGSLSQDPSSDLHASVKQCFSGNVPGRFRGRNRRQ